MVAAGIVAEDADLAMERPVELSALPFTASARPRDKAQTH
jgi:hypothetical protein